MATLSRIHHVGIVVRSLEEAYAFWRDAVGLAVHKEATVKDQGVRAALLPCGETEIELLEPIDPEGGVAKFLAKRGEGLHHLCFETDDVAEALAAAKAKGLPMIDEKPRQGLAGMIGFLHPKASCGVLVEYATPPAGAGVGHAAEVAFDHLALIVDDLPEATSAFSRNFDLRAGAASGVPVRLPIGRSAILMYAASAAPAALAGIHGLAGIGLRMRSGGARLDRITAAAKSHRGASEKSLEYGTTAHGVPLALRVAGGT
jgi:methylmalonyl-CoA/ethylmalonyl-CoA epimerase